MDVLIPIVAVLVGAALGVALGFALNRWPQSVKDSLKKGQVYGVAVFIVVILAPGVIGLTTGTWSTCRYPDPSAAAAATQTASAQPANRASGAASPTTPAITTSPLPSEPTRVPTPNPTVINLQTTLIYEVGEYYTHSLCLSRVNWAFDNWVKFVAVFAAFFTTLSSGVSWKELGIASGAIATAMTGIQTLYPFSDRAQFNDKIAARVDNVRSELLYGAPFEAGEDKLLVFLEHERSSLQTIKQDAAAGPSGQISATPTAVVTVTPSPATTSPVPVSVATLTPTLVVKAESTPDVTGPSPSNTGPG